jgi:hypothetical protein
MAQLKLAFDVPNQRLVVFNGSSADLPPFRQGFYDPVIIYLVQEVAGAFPGEARYEAFDITGFDSIRLGFFSASTGTIGDSGDYLLAIASQDVWDYDATDPDAPFFTGSLNTYTTQVADWIGTAAFKAAYFCLNLVAGTNLHPVYDQRNGGTNCIINAATDEGGGVPVNVTTTPHLVTLPWHFLDPGSGEVYALTRTAPGTLTFVWLNP